MTAHKRKKSLVGWINRDWYKEFCYPMGCLRSNIPDLLKEPSKNKFYNYRFDRIKVRLTIEEI